METDKSNPERDFYIGDWLVQPHLLRISRKGITRKLEPQLMAVLQYMVKRQGETVGKSDLMSAVWGNVIVTENVLTRSISTLRKVLGDDPLQPLYIETISKKGYRLIAKISEESPKSRGRFFDFLSRRKIESSFGAALVLVLLVSSASKKVVPVEPSLMVNPRAIAHQSNSEYWPAISSDGKFVAYSWKGRSNDNWDVYAKIIGTDNPIRVTDNAATDLRARWSPDNTSIYFLRYKNGKATIYKKAFIGGDEVRIIDAPKLCSGDFDISPDEKWISFNGRENAGDPLRVKLISLETGQTEWLTNPNALYNGDIHPTFSHDGTSIAFIRERNPTSMQLWIYDRESGKSKQVTSDHESINGFDWSSDENGLLYSSNSAGLYRLWKLNLDTHKKSQVISGDYQMVMPRVAKSGQVVYAKMKDNVNIWAYDMEVKKSNLWRSTSGLDLNAVVSPDKQMVCFTGEKNGVFQIWTADIEGKRPKVISDFNGQYLSAPRWSSDGKQIVFQGFLNGQTDIYIIDREGGIAENLTNSNYEDHTPFCVSDKIYFSSNRSGSWAIWMMNMDGSDVKEVVSSNSYGPQADPVNKIIYYSKKDQLGLWAFDLLTTTESKVIDAFHPMYWGAYCVDESGIHFFNPKEKEVQFYSTKNNLTTTIFNVPKRFPRMGVTLEYNAADGVLLFGQIDQNDADIMALNDI